jgi:hypothetical protein
MLGTLENYEKSDWKSHVAPLVHAYNVTIHTTTGYSPYFLMFGRHPKLAIDAFLGLPTDENNNNTQTEYVRKLKERLSIAYKKAEDNAKHSADKYKTRYDIRAKAATINKGDLVLVRNVKLRGKNKLADKWEDTPYIVMEQPNQNIPVFVVKKDSPRSNKTRTLHRNLLLPLSKKVKDPYLETKHNNEDPEIERNITYLEPEMKFDTSASFKKDTYLENQQGKDSRPDNVLENTSDKYIIPARRCKPNNKNKCLTSADDKAFKGRPIRTRITPRWQRSGDWILDHKCT